MWILFVFVVDNSSHTLEAHLEACRKLRSRHQNNRSGDEFCDARDLNDPNRDPSEPFFKSKAVDESWIVQWAVRLRIVILLLALGCITYVLISLALYWFSPPSPRPLPSQSPQPSAGSPKDSTTEDGGCDWDCFKFLWQWFLAPVPALVLFSYSSWHLGCFVFV